MTHNERVLDLLSDGEPHSHHELYALYVVAHSRISDLRKKGYRIEQWRDGDTYWYQLVGALTEREAGGRNVVGLSCHLGGGTTRSVRPTPEPCPRSVNASAGGLDDGHLSVTPHGQVPRVPVIEAVCDDSGQLVLA